MTLHDPSDLPADAPAAAEETSPAPTGAPGTFADLDLPDARSPPSGSPPRPRSRSRRSPPSSRAAT